ncbi:sulfite exporter TauE/SafE family protein [Neisseria sp. Ec49-e6-T10]|uniref:sulfite exporter TauE/SafE family protein n=1 Tax=Neisseria sp. Ec49-e6-T10 TaxID=3140744 RepID=UPI003EBFA1F4
MDTTIALLVGIAFLAGLMDAAVGGGGLIQIPGIFSFLPNHTPAVLFGTNKFASICGTATAAREYIKKIKVPWRLILPTALLAFIFSYLGAKVVTYIPVAWMKPAILVLLIVIGIYTFIKKDFGRLHTERALTHKDLYIGMLIGASIGFYDGIFGPGTGSFLTFLFIRIYAFDFLHATAAAKVVNLATNFAALSFFIPSGNILWAFAIPMAISNIFGGFVGARLAILGGAKVLRICFLCLMCILISKFAYDLFFMA